MDRALYDEAIHKYVRACGRRADAIYLTGNIRFPGLSDLDMLVVTSHRSRDNAQFFSAVYRLGARYAPILLHEPMVVPQNHKNVLRYSSHRHLKLLCGKDVFEGVEFIDDRAERWCKLLERYCSHAAFVHAVRAAQQCRGRRLIAKASSLRFGLRELDALLATDVASNYEASIDQLRARYFDEEPARALMSAWKMYESAFEHCTRVLHDTLQLKENDVVEEFTKRLFSGAARFNEVPHAYVATRSGEIDRYHEELAKLHIPFGQIFFWEAHGQRSRMYRQSKLDNTVYRAKYKVLRALA